MEEAKNKRWREMTDPGYVEGIIYNPEWPFRCCNKEMTIEEDSSACCYSCGRYIPSAVPCATREQCLSNSRIRKPYNRIKYFREWMRHSQEEPQDTTTCPKDSKIPGTAI